MIRQPGRKIAISLMAAAFLLSASAQPSRALFGWGKKSSSTSAALAAAISTVSGQVQYKAAGTTSWKPARAQQALSAGDTVKAGPGGKAIIALTDGSVLEVSSGATFIFKSHSARKVELKVAIGLLKAWIKKSRRRYTVRTPTSVAAVRGTEFQVNVGPSGRATWDLFGGSLDVSDNFGNSTSLAAGRRLVATKNKGLGEAKPIPRSVKATPKPKVAPPPAPKTPPKAVPPSDEPPPSDDPPPPDDPPATSPQQDQENTEAECDPTITPSFPGACP